mgnify:CR=1 FL=1
MSRKYKNIKTVVDEHAFDSITEANRYGELKLLLKAGEIGSLVVHPKFSLDVNGVHICTYTADFQYNKGKKTIVEDVKSPATVTYSFKLKQKLMKALHGIDVKIVMR